MATLAISDPDFAIALTAIVLSFVFGMVTMIVRSSRNNAIAKEREISRREIAAYIAEGSITPEQGERLMAAGEKPGQKD